jgi:hypothetical protein
MWYQFEAAMSAQLPPLESRIFTVFCVNAREATEGLALTPVLVPKLFEVGSATSNEECLLWQKAADLFHRAIDEVYSEPSYRGCEKWQLNRQTIF